MTHDAALALDASPARLRYVAALRGVVPAPEGDSFTYLQTGLDDPQELMCLAVSNPEGLFIGHMRNAQAVAAAEQEAKRRTIANISFVMSLEATPHKIDFLCYDAPQETTLPESLFDIADKKLSPGGIFCLRYQTSATEDSLLQFLIAKYVPELSAPEKEVFCQELGALGHDYFARHPIALKNLEKALLNKTLGNFFETCGAETAPASGTFQALEALLPRDFAYVGDAQIASNYVELTVSQEAQTPLLAHQDNVFYESLKDFALARLVRSDIWVRMPSTQSSDMPTLFNPFTFGISTPREKIPPKIKTRGGLNINLQTPLFANLIDLMTKLPAGVGDFMAHPLGSVFSGPEVLSAIQILVATGIAQPMRGRYEARTEGDAQIVPTESVNSFLTPMTISTASVRLASPVAGFAITLSAREALVLQDISRAGLDNSVGALFQELERLAKQNPALAAKIMDTAEPSPAMADAMLRNVIDHDVTRWYAYGLMAA